MVPLELNAYAEGQIGIAKLQGLPPPYREDQLQRALNRAVIPPKQKGEEMSAEGMAVPLRNVQRMTMDAGAAQVDTASCQSFAIQLLKRTSEGDLVTVANPDEAVGVIDLTVQVSERLNVRFGVQKIEEDGDVQAAIVAAAEATA